MQHSYWTLKGCGHLSAGPTGSTLFSACLSPHYPSLLCISTTPVLYILPGHIKTTPFPVPEHHVCWFAACPATQNLSIKCHLFRDLFCSHHGRVRWPSVCHPWISSPGIKCHTCSSNITVLQYLHWCTCTYNSFNSSIINEGHHYLTYGSKQSTCDLPPTTRIRTVY